MPSQTHQRLVSPSLAPQFSPDSLHVAENSKEHEVTLHSTVPIPCYTPEHGHQCGVPLALSVHDPGQTYRKTENIACVVVNRVDIMKLTV